MYTHLGYICKECKEVTKYIYDKASVLQPLTQQALGIYHVPGQYLSKTSAKMG